MRTSGSFVFSGTLTLVGQEAENKQNAGELVTDRPDFTESTEVAPKGWLQWESGVQFDKAGDAKGYISGAPLLRFGIAKRFELRLSTDGMVGERDARAPMRRGLADAGVGFKYKLRDESKWLPAFSVIPAVSLPMGHRAFTSSRADPGVKFAVAKDVSAGFELSSNFNFNAPSDGDGRYHQNAATISVGHGFGERFAGYWELWTFNHDERGSGRMTVFQTGVTTAIGQNTQLDFSVGRRLTPVGPDWMFAFGWATRHPLGGVNFFRK